MRLKARRDQPLPAHRLRFDSGAASVDTLKGMVRLKLVFVSRWKDHRRVSLSPAAGYSPLQDLDWTAYRLEHRGAVQLQAVPCRVPLFTGVAPHGDLEWVSTPPAGTFTTSDLQDENALGGQIEPWHRQRKPLTGTEPGAGRQARWQPNPSAGWYQAGLSLKGRAPPLSKSW